MPLGKPFFQANVNDAGMVRQAICIDLGHYLSFSHQDFFFHSHNLCTKAAPMNKNTAIPQFIHPSDSGA